MKKSVILILATVLVIGLFAGCIKVTIPENSPSASAETPATVQPTATATPEETAPPETTTTQETPNSAAGTFTLKNGSMSIKIPDGWTSADSSSDAMALGTMMSADMKGTIALLNMKLPVVPDASALDQAYGSSAAGAVPGGTVVSQKDITISGAKGKFFEITGKTNGMDAHVLLVVLIKGDMVYTATGIAAEADFAAYKDILSSTLQSLTVQ